MINVIRKDKDGNCTNQAMGVNAMVRMLAREAELSDLTKNDNCPHCGLFYDEGYKDQQCFNNCLK